MDSKISETVNNVKKFGVANCHEWLEEADLNICRKITKEINCPHTDNRGIFELNVKYRLIELFFKFRFKKFRQTNYFDNLAKKLSLKEISSQILDAESRLVRIDCYVTPKSDKPALDWHFDQAYSGEKNVTKFQHPNAETIKFFFHLTDVAYDNGLFCYIPKSHFIAIALKKGIYEGKLKYTPYWSLNDFRNTILIKENYNFIKNNVDSEILDEFIEKTDPTKVKSNPAISSINQLSIKAGGARIFNDSGSHKGSKTKITERLALRFHYGRKEMTSNLY